MVDLVVFAYTQTSTTVLDATVGYTFWKVSKHGELSPALSNV